MTDLVIQGQTWTAMKEQALMLVKSKFLPDSITTPEQAMAIAIKGYEIGMPMMQAFSQIHVIKGKPTLSAEGMNALIRKNCPGAKLEILVTGTTQCTIRATRPGEQSCEFTFTLEDAKRAGITGNPSWSKYPEAMLFARCISIVARRMFPDCLNGISYTPEELGAEVNADGEVINITPEGQRPAVEGGQAKQKTPETLSEEEYDQENIQHKAEFKKIAATFGVTDNRSLKAVSAVCNGIQMRDLAAGIEEFLEDHKPHSIMPEPPPQEIPPGPMKAEAEALMERINNFGKKDQ